jgi:NAD(P)H-dependent flavin oxidoreductase YrpB (nitropropane dioxygenase family)
VNMGTRFIATAEAPVHDNVKRQVVANTELDTRLIFRSLHNTARVARNSVSEEIARICSAPGATFAEVADLASGVRGRQRVLSDGDVEGGVWWAGQTQGLIDDVAPCAEVIERIVVEATDIIGRRLPGLLA